MRIAVEPWAPEFGTPLDISPTELPTPQVDTAIELPTDRWEPRATNTSPAGCVVFVDGIRRVDARLWIGDGAPRAGIAASFASGAVRCDGTATVVVAEVRRAVFGSGTAIDPLVTEAASYLPHQIAGDTTDALVAALQQEMRALEARVAAGAPPCDLLVLDGPLAKTHALPPHAIGFVKTHQRQYLPEELSAVVGRLAPGERTPLFVTTTSWSRYSWYLRLPLPSGQAPGHPWSGIVRGEAHGDLSVGAAAAIADLSAATLPEYASLPHKDPRAPQNLVPIAELERTLRRRLGDPGLLYRALVRAAAAPAGA